MQTIINETFRIDTRVIISNIWTKKQRAKLNAEVDKRIIRTTEVKVRTYQ